MTKRTIVSSLLLSAIVLPIVVSTSASADDSFNANSIASMQSQATSAATNAATNAASSAVKQTLDPNDPNRYIQQQQPNANKDATQSKALTKTYVSIGTGVSDDDKDKLLKALGVDKDKDTQFNTDGHQLLEYLQLDGIVDSQVKSSVRVQPAEKGTGIKVDIVDFDGHNNITTITSQQYALAATTAGVKDAIITVSSPSKVDGSGALAGVYQALAKNGTDLDPRNTTAANNLLNTQSNIIEANKKNDSVPGKLTGATAAAIADSVKQQNDGQITQQDVTNNLNKQLKKQGLGDLANTQDSQVLGMAAYAVTQTPAARTSGYASRMTDASKNLLDSDGQKMSKSGELKGSNFFDKAVGGVQSFGHAVGGFFSGIFNSFSKEKTQVKTTKQAGLTTDSTSSSDKVADGASNQTSDGTSNSSLLLKAFNQWNGKNETLVSNWQDGKAKFTDQELHDKMLTNGNATFNNPVNGLKLSALDNLGRSQIANAYITKESMSGTQARIPIPASSAPSGWYSITAKNKAQYNQQLNMWVGTDNKTQKGLTSNNKKVNGGYAYNRGHMIGYQFFDNLDSKTNGGGNGNAIMSINNLTTQTREANAPAQEHIENAIAKAVQAGHEVRLQVVPVYQGNELVPRLYHYQAESADDNGKSVNINVIIINGEEGVKVDYQTGNATGSGSSNSTTDSSSDSDAAQQ